MHLPQPRGPFSTAVVDRLIDPSPTTEGGLRTAVRESATGIADDEDRLLALWLVHGLSYHGYTGVDPDLEWDLPLLQARVRLEAALEQDLLAAARPVVEEFLPEARQDLTATLFSLPDRVAADAPSISA